MMQPSSHVVLNNKESAESQNAFNKISTLIESQELSHQIKVLQNSPCPKGLFEVHTCRVY